MTKCGKGGATLRQRHRRQARSAAGRRLIAVHRGRSSHSRQLIAQPPGPSAIDRRLAAVRRGRRLSPRPRAVGRHPSPRCCPPRPLVAQPPARNASELEVTEWVIQDEPGVYITVRELADGTRELRRVRFSRERFAELNAKLWWEENKERIQAQINMASDDASNSACASTNTSPGGTMAAVTGHSASAPKRSASNALVPHEATTVTGGEGTEPVVIPDEDDGAFTGEVEPALKRQKKCTSKKM
ncbi:hypothetical protein E2562_022822 [Oryza meyeriana var. granulata]|uniref:BRX domain-containing protein n=1 Tax=Oryza meyeriana var. granulata TaxID=110450 RepID=A0A6G1FAZ6_9ORYZ|nr:hypothetical protein E2562_022822 [Oryza meyeriana var. granulata]